MNDRSKLCGRTEAVPSNMGRESTTMTENRLPDDQACNKTFSTTEDLQVGVNICTGVNSLARTVHM